MVKFALGEDIMSRTAPRLRASVAEVSVLSTVDRVRLLRSAHSSMKNGIAKSRSARCDSFIGALTAL